MKRLLIFAVFVFSNVYSFAQLTNSASSERIVTAVPFLLISVNARTSSMGDAGTAAPITSNSLEVGLSRTAFIEEKTGFNLTYVPWLNNLVKDRKLMYASGFLKLSDRSTITSSVKYLSYGQFDLIDDQKVGQGSVSPSEFALAFGIARSFGKNFSLATNVKYIRSNLYSATNNNVQIQGGNTFAVDVSVFNSYEFVNATKPLTLGLSVNVLNIGPKMAYYYDPTKRFYLPTTLKLGSALTVGDNANSELIFAFDVNKLLVPSNQSNLDNQGLQNDKSVLEGMLSSFSDSKDGLIGELREVGFSLGVEYNYDKKIAFRTGYNYQDKQSGFGSFFSVGTGIKYKMIGVDLSYLVGDPQETFSSNTLRFTIGYSFSK